jgi:hypothetical protein
LYDLDGDLMTFANFRSDIDFFDVGQQEFYTLDNFIEYIVGSVDLSSIEGDLSVLGGVSDFETVDEFCESVSSHFTLKQRNGKLLLFNASEHDVPYYVFFGDNDFPIIFTTGRKTEDLPITIDDYLKNESDMGRLWISKREMENLRQRILQNHSNVLMTYFTGTRSRHAEIQSQRRPRYKRTIQYYGKDALETFNEMKYEYGILPTNLTFQKSNEFKFRVTTRGVFTIKHGGLREVLNVIRESIERLREVKSAIDESGYRMTSNKFAHGQTMPESRPWAVQLSSPIDQRDVRQFESEELENDWEFTLSELDASFERDTPYFKAQLVDKRTLGETVLQSHEESIRIYPRESTGIDQSIRVFEFINDQIDPDSFATVVT